MPSPKSAPVALPRLNLLELNHVTKDYPGVTALSDISLEIRRGETLAIAGANGAGKSTLVRLIAGVERPTRGEMILAGRLTRFQSPRDAIECGIHTIHQESHLAPHLSIAENIFLGRLPTTRLGLLDRDRLRSEAAAALDRLGVSIEVDQPVSSLSVAKRQIVEIAKSIGQDCRILILDEPSAVLGRQDLAGLFKIIASLKAEGTTILYISHRLEEVFEISDRLLVLRDGKKVRSCPTNEIQVDGLIEAITGRSTTVVSSPAHDLKPGKVVLEVKNLSRSGHFQDVSFQISQGEIVGLAGKVGSGRSEVARAIFGAAPPDQGQLLLFGTPHRIRSPQDAIRLGVGLVPEDRKTQGLLLQRNIIENVSLSNLDPYLRWKFLRLGLEFKRVAKLCGSLLLRAPSLFVLVKFLSGGNQQKVVLARWLNSDSAILILDEPTRGVDVGAKAEIYRLVEELKRQGRAILLISSEETELYQMADRIVVMKDGTVTAVLSRGLIGWDRNQVEGFME